MTANGSLAEEGGIVQGEITGYDGQTNHSDYGGGSRRRKRGKRNSKKNSRRRSKKYMKKMYRGGEGEETVSQDTSETKYESESGTETENKDSEPDVEPSVGGRRKSKKMRKGKMNKSKKMRKGKVSKWITHVKNFARSNKMDFRDALKDPKCKSSYHKMK
jgi:hypothetical protein